MRKVVKHNALSLFFLALFLVALVLQAVAGHADFNEDQLRHDNPTMSLGRYVVSSEFGTAVLENWQSEYLQFTLFILATVWLLQRGSPESKELDKAGRESDEDQRVGRHARASSPRWARVGGIRRTRLPELTADRDGRDLAGELVRSVGHRCERVQRRAPRPPPARRLLARLPGPTGLLGEDPAELAVGVPRRRVDGHPRRLPAAARVAGVEARRGPSRLNRRSRASDPPPRFRRHSPGSRAA